MSNSGSQFSVVISDSTKTVTSNVAVLTVSGATDVLTYHNDIARTGQNLTEAILTTVNVNSASFGKLGFYPVDGLVDAQPLYASNVAVPNNGTHNLLIVVTEHGSAYAFDADSGAAIWQISTLGPGETTSNDVGCLTCPEIGVNATPVIDRTRGPNGAIYLVAASKDESDNLYHQRIHAIDLALGTELFGGPTEIHATYPGLGDYSDGTNVVWDAYFYRERSALLLLNGVIYTTWASHYDSRPYTGWIIGYDESTLAQTSVLNVTPNGNAGAIWMSGSGPAADNSGNIYLLDGNGIFDDTLNSSGFPSEGDFGNAFLKLSTSNGLSVSDYFETNDEANENASDVDLGSGGAMLLPDLSDGSGHTMHLAVGAGKDEHLYVVNRDSMGKLSQNDSNIYQKLPFALPDGIWAAPAYFNNTVYYGAVTAPLLAFTITNAKLSTAPAAQTSTSFAYPGTTPSISANGTSNAIVWAVEVSAPTVTPAYAILHAYDATSLQELYNSNQASNGRDQYGSSPRFITPTIANGKVFVETPTGVAVFGLLPKS